MNCYEFIIYAMIFLSIMIAFYLIISKFNNVNKYDDVSSLKNNILIISKELSSIKQQLPNTESTSESTSESKSESKSEFQTQPQPQSQSRPQSQYQTQPQSEVSPNININTDSNSHNASCPSGSCSKPPPIIFDPIANFDRAKLSDPLVDPRGRSSADQIPTPQVALQFNYPTQGVIDRYHRIGLLIALDKEADDLSEDVSYDKRIKRKRRPSISSESDSKVKPYKGVQLASFIEGFASIDGSESDIDSEIEGFQNTTNIYNISGNAGENDILELIGRKITDNWYKYFTSISKGNKIIKIVVRNRNRRELYSGDIVFIPELGKSYRVKIDSLDQIEYNPYMF